MEGRWACILCGGRGSRLGSITETIPKPLVKVHGKPIIWYSFLSLYKHGFRNFIFPVGYKGEMVRKYIYDIFGGMGCEIYCVDTGEDTSIAGRMAQIVDLIPDGEDFFLINSDTLFDFDIGAMYEQHKREDALLTLSSVEVVSSWGLIYMWNGKMVDFDRERKIRYVLSEDVPGEQGLINSGLAFLNKAALELIDLTEAGINFEPILYQTIIRMGRASLFEIKGIWFPIDTPKDLDIVNMVAPDINGVGKEAQAVKQNLGGDVMTEVMFGMDKAIAEVKAVREHDEAMLSAKAAINATMHNKITGIACSDPRRVCDCLYSVFLQRKFIAKAILGGEAFKIPAGIDYMEAINLLDDTIKKELFL